MTQRTRYFIVGSGLIVVVGLCTGLVAYYNGGLGGRQASGPSELAYLPSNVSALAYADVRHIMDSEFRQRLQALIPTGDEKARLRAEMGIDVERDIDSVVLGLGPAGPGVGGPVALVRGRFNQAQIEAAALQHGATAEDYRGTHLLTALSAGPGAAGGRTGGIAFLEPGLLAMGEAEAVRHAIDAAVTHDTVTNNAEVMRFVADVSTSGDAWVVGKFDAVSRQDGVPDAVKGQLSNVQWFALSAGVDRALTCRLRAEAKDAQSGENMRAVVNGAIAVAKMMASKDARFDGMFNTLQASGTGSELEMSFTVPAELLDVVGRQGSPAAGTLQAQ